MMNDWLDRTRRLLGEEALTALAGARVAVLGLGGVGSAAAEGVCRGGGGSPTVTPLTRPTATGSSSPSAPPRAGPRLPWLPTGWRTSPRKPDSPSCRSG